MEYTFLSRPYRRSLRPKPSRGVQSGGERAERVKRRGAKSSTIRAGSRKAMISWRPRRRPGTSTPRDTAAAPPRRAPPPPGWRPTAVHGVVAQRPGENAGGQRQVPAQAGDIGHSGVGGADAGRAASRAQQGRRLAPVQLTIRTYNRGKSSETAQPTDAPARTTAPRAPCSETRRSPADASPRLPSTAQDSNIYSPHTATPRRVSQIAPIYVSLHRSDLRVA